MSPLSVMTLKRTALKGVSEQIIPKVIEPTYFKIASFSPANAAKVHGTTSYTAF